MAQESHYLTGRLLLAMPGMGDPRFDRSVIALCQHDENGAFGIGIGEVRNDVRLHAVFAEVGIDPGTVPDGPVLNGGPVEPGRGFIFHSGDWPGQDSIVVEGLGALSASVDILRAIAAGHGPSRWLFALGYAGWGPGQLDGEMQGHGWYAASGHKEILFDTPVASRWLRCWRAEGIDPSMLANCTGRA